MKPSHITKILLVVSSLLLTPPVWGAEGKDVAYRSGDETVHGLMFAPSGKGPFPGLLAIHAVFGLDAWTKEQASKLADAGYVVLALDFYQGKVAKTLDEGVQLSRAVPTSRKQQDMLAAIQFLRSQANVSQDRVGSIGWCMGGRWAFQLATLDPLLKAAVVRYGSLSSDPSVLANINAHILGIFGGKDTSIPIAEIHNFEQQMKSLGKQAEVVIYPEAGHAFEYSESTAKGLGLLKAAYPADAAYQGPRPDETADAWRRTVDFLDANLKSDKSVSDAEQEVLALEQQMEALFRSNREARIALWADDLVYITNRGAVMDKARVATQVSTDQVHVESLEVAETKVRVYGDVAVVTALERMRASYHGKEARDLVQRYTRIWARRGGKWQIVLFQATGVSSTAVQTVGATACSSEAAAETSPATSASLEQAILKLEDERTLASSKGDFAKRSGGLGDDYVAINEAGRLGDKATAIDLYSSGKIKLLAAKFAQRRVLLFGAVAILTGTSCHTVLQDGQESVPALRWTHVWVKRNGNWQVVSWQGSPIVPPQEFAPGSTTPPQDAQRLAPTTDDTNHAQDEAAIRKTLADVDNAWDRQDAKAIVVHGSENHDHINVGGAWRQGKVETEKAMTAYFEAHRSNPSSAAQSIEKIRFITPHVAILVVRHKYNNDTRTWEAISTSVWHKINGEWWNEAFQNTRVQSREEAIAQAARASSPMAQTEPQVITPADSKMDFSGDVAAIRKLVAESVDAWNRRDPKFVTAHSSENHDHIDVLGEWRQGKAETEKAMAAALATTRNNISSAIAKIRFITPDLAIVIVRNEYTNDKETLKSISTSILHKINGEWWDDAFQNTYVRPSESSPLPNPREQRH